ncbi:HyaD/HybD family hydrogenase maturation endopeptidase [Bradyrhizobium sp. Tv2a-2]|uniref:HyaD/HybD family hydrogenase maturation endopeptidase n=1 Tax=Bradyrhizobium sp. Tv2a-2 TaxID=113395 RepID=UPI0003FEFEE2|nr:HyaD/HybD family hydrogenase maturation endopeptidase [Bradyrhizobium sp. Tv2a-2]
MSSIETTKRILVLGVGNVLWADEGFGVRAVDEFYCRYSVPGNVTVVDGGTRGLYLLSYIEETDCLIVFDAIEYSLKPGQLRLLRNEEVPRFTGAKKMSLHQTGLQDVLSAADLLGRFPREMALIGCQPLNLEDWCGPLTSPVRAQIGPAIDLACQLLKQWGSEAQLRRVPLRNSGNLPADVDHATSERKARRG